MPDVWLRIQSTSKDITTSTSCLTVTPLVDTGQTADELRLLDFGWAIENLVTGTGFDLTVWTESEAKGTYTFFVTGV